MQMKVGRPVVWSCACGANARVGQDVRRSSGGRFGSQQINALSEHGQLGMEAQRLEIADGEIEGRFAGWS